MAKEKKIKEEKKEEEKEDLIKLKYFEAGKKYPKARFSKIRDAVLKAIKELSPELNRQFDMSKIISALGTKGLLRDELKDLKMEDRYAIFDIFQRLVRDDEILLHKSGKWYVRVK